MSDKQDLVIGAVVKWTQAEGYGVIIGINDGNIQIRWDGNLSHPPQFAVSNPPLLRIDFAGKLACRQSTGEEVAVQNLLSESESRPTWRCRVFSQGGGYFANLPEGDLRPMLVTVADPVEKFRNGEIGPLQKYRLQEAARWYHAQHLHDDLVSLGQIQVDIKAHQVCVVHKVISDYPHRFLLCDEVGLGKTIEAGMILKEIKSRGGAQRVLAIVPPNLVRQWQFEMKSKFNESFAVLDANTIRFLRNQGYADNPFSHPDFPNVLCSSRWVARDEIAKLCAEADWDLIIIDEAHHARRHPDGSTTRLYRLALDLAPAEHITRRGMLLLTATPMQLNTHELYSLIEILDPTLFPSHEHFENHRQAVPGLSRLVERLYHNGFPFPDERPSETAELVAKWLDIEPTMAHTRLSAAKDDQTELEQLAKELEGKHRLSEVLIRNRKAVVGGFMPRTAYRWEVELSPEERAAQQAVEEYVQYGYQLAEGGNNSIGFVMVIFQKLMASSIAAIRAALGKRREKILAGVADLQSSDDIDDRIDDDDDAGDVVAASGSTANGFSRAC